MKAKFVGDPANPGEPLPDVFDAFGVTFPRDKFVDVPKRFEDKFAGNSHFQVQGAKAEKPEETAESTAEFAARVNEITDREGLEAMLEAEKRPAAKGVLQARLDAMPVARAE